MKVALYARVSTDKQTVENQIEKLKEYIKIRDFELVGIFRDHAISGKKARRPELDTMMDLIKKGKINAVLVWKLDRIGRSMKDLISLLDFFRIHNCQFISFNNNMDTSTSEGRLLFHILAAFAEFEADLISERTKLAYNRKSTHAAALGNKPRWGRKSKQEMVDMNFVKQKRNDGWSWRKIADNVDGVSYSTIRRLFQNG